MVWSSVRLVRALVLPAVALASGGTWSSTAAAALDELASPQPPPDLPRGSYVRVAPTEDAASGPFLPGPDGSPHILYLNRCAGGLTITAGWPDDNVVNRSGILGGTVNFPEYPFGDSSWNQVVEHTRQIYSPFNVLVTDEDPSPMPHDEAIVCGSGSLAGFGGAGGVAPFTCGVIDAPITFTFPESLGDYPRSIAEVIGQESAHAWGLEHEYKCEDPMSYLYGCGDKTFQDGDYQCGEYNPRACECGGNTQNSYQYILGLFGSAVPDTQAPIATIVTPHDGEVFAVGDDFDISVQVSDDNQIELVSLYLDGAISSEDMSEPFGPWPVIDAPEGSYEFYIVAKDAAGKTTQSNMVRVEVSAEPGAGGGNGGGGGDGDGGSADDDGDGDDDGANDGGSDDGDTDGGFDVDDSSALPAGFGLDGEPAGCACRSTPGGSGLGAWWCALVLGWGARRRASPTSPSTSGDP